MSKPADSDWSHLFATEPTLPYALAQAESVSSAAALAMPIDEMIKSSTGANMIGPILDKVHYSGADKVLPVWLDKAEKAWMSDRSNQETAGAFRQVFAKAIDLSPKSVSPDTIRKVKDADPGYHREILDDILQSGAGGREILDDEIKLVGKAINATNTFEAGLSRIFESPHIVPENEKACITVLRNLTGHALDQSIDKISQNVLAPPNLVDHALSMHNERGGDAEVSINFLKHPGAPRGWIMEQYRKNRENAGIDFERRKFNLAELENPTYGGDLFRAMPEGQAVPKSLRDHVDGANMISKAEHSTNRNRLQQVLPKIPAEGVSWVDFKRANKPMENWPEVRKLFEGKMGGADKVMPEDVAKTMQQYPANEFHISYTTWGGAQRHMDRDGDVPNLVMQVNTSAEIEKELAKDPKLFKFFQHVQKWGNHSGHPVNPHCIGWVRIDPRSKKEGWVVEEFQSDFSSRLRKDMDEVINQAPEKLREELGFHATPAELMGFAAKTEKILQGWYHAAVSGVEQLARKQGVKNLYIHGVNVRARMSGMDSDRPYPVKLQEMYDQDPPKFGYERCDYSDYPKFNQQLSDQVKSKGKDDDKKDTRCWRKRLT
jgi:hypothetical protein